MKVPEKFRTRIAGNIYENTPDLVVCDDTTILRVDRADDTGRLKVRLAVFDSNGRRDAFVMLHAPDGFLIHASPAQTNLGTQAKGEIYRDLDHALVV